MTQEKAMVTAKGSGDQGNFTYTTSTSNYPIGKYTVAWDGFDSNGVYDSTIFTTGKLKARIKGKRNGKEKTAESGEFSFERDQKKADWVDVKIDKNSKRIEVTLRVNLTDGGAEGLEDEDSDKIPKKDLIPGKPPLKTRTRSFNDLEQLALEGLNTYWSRNKENIGKGVEIDGELYEVFINSLSETNSEKSLNDIPLIYNTNNPWSRSGNTGGSYNDGHLADEIMQLLPDGIVQRISYNDGYIKYSNGWYYQP